MNHFDTDNREFAKSFVKYGVIPTDKDLPYEADEESAMGNYVHPLKDMKKMKKTVRIGEHELREIISKSITKIISEMLKQK